MKIRFSPESVDDLQRLYDFLVEHDPGAARAVALNLQSAMRRFVELPYLGKPVEGMDAAVREFVFGRYVIRYMVKEEAIYILRVWHAKEQR